MKGREQNAPRAPVPYTFRQFLYINTVYNSWCLMVYHFMSRGTWNSLSIASLGSSLILGLFWIFFALFAYLSVLNVSSKFQSAGPMLAIITVFVFPPRESYTSSALHLYHIHQCVPLFRIVQRQCRNKYRLHFMHNTGEFSHNVFSCNA